jgi:hypothetical protein
MIRKGEWTIFFMEKGTNPASNLTRETKLWSFLSIRGLKKASWIILLNIFTCGFVEEDVND